MPGIGLFGVIEEVLPPTFFPFLVCIHPRLSSLLDSYFTNRCLAFGFSACVITEYQQRLANLQVSSISQVLLMWMHSDFRTFLFVSFLIKNKLNELLTPDWKDLVKGNPLNLLSHCEIL